MTELQKERNIKFSEGLHWCNYYKKYLPVSEFHKNKHGVFGLQSNSKDFFRMKSKQWNKKRKGYETPFDSGIYKIVDTRDNSIVYIGRTSSMSRRWYSHLSGAKTNDMQFLRRPANDDDREIFKFIPWIEETNKLVMKQLEDDLIKQYNPILNIKGRKTA